MSDETIRDQVMRRLYDSAYAERTQEWRDSFWALPNTRLAYERSADAVLALPIFQAVAYEAWDVAHQRVCVVGAPLCSRHENPYPLTGPDPLDAVRAEAAAVERGACATIADFHGAESVADAIRLRSFR